MNGMSKTVAWSAFLLGIGASTAANVAHAHAQIGPRLTAAVAPLALTLAVELAVRVSWKPGAAWFLARWGGTGLVGAVTAVVSYRHQSGLFALYGEDSVSAAILPLSIDGLMLVSAAALLALSTQTVHPVVSLSAETVRPLSTQPEETTDRETDGQRTETVHGLSADSSVDNGQMDKETNGQRTVSLSMRTDERMDSLRTAFPDKVPSGREIKETLGLKSQSVAHRLRTELARERAS
jgi:hypothetical protein